MFRRRAWIKTSRASRKKSRKRNKASLRRKSRKARSFSHWGRSKETSKGKPKSSRKPARGSIRFRPRCKKNKRKQKKSLIQSTTDRSCCSDGPSHFIVG